MEIPTWDSSSTSVCEVWMFRSVVVGGDERFTGAGRNMSEEKEEERRRRKEEERGREEERKKEEEERKRGGGEEEKRRGGGESDGFESGDMFALAALKL